MYKRDYGMNVMEQIFKIRSCIEILANDIKVDTTDQYSLQLTIQTSSLECGFVWEMSSGRTNNGLKEVMCK